MRLPEDSRQLFVTMTRPMRLSLALLLSQIIFIVPTFGHISGEAPASTSVYGNAPAEQTSAMVGSDGDTFLAVWLDTREETERLYAARFSSSGVLLDPTGIRIPASPSGVNRNITAVLSLQGVWVVIWTEQVFTSDMPSAHSTVMAVRIDRDGHLIDGPRVVLSDAYAPLKGAATNGSRIVVIYADKYAVLDQNAILMQRDLALPVHGTNNYTTGVASNGSGFTITWVASLVNAIEAISLDTNGNVIGTRSQLITAGAQQVALASDGNEYLIVTRDFVARQFSARRLSSKAEALDLPTVLPTVTGIPTSGDLVWNGSAYVFATTTTIEMSGSAYQQVLGMRLDRTGQPLDSDPFALSEPAFGSRTMPASVASNGRDIASTWHGVGALSGDDTFAAVVNGSSLHRSDPVLLSRSANFQTNPSLAFSGQNYLALWREVSGTYISRLSLEGQALDGRGIRVAAAGEQPRVIFDGANYLVGWITSTTNSSILWITRMTPDGQILDSDGIPVAQSSCSFSFDMASSGDTTLVAWDECRYKAIRVTRLDRSARPVDLPLAVTPDSMRTANPSVAWNGSEYLVAFQEQISTPSPILIPGYEAFRSNVRGTRISSGMTVLDPEPLAIAVSDSDDQSTPHAASNGKDFLVAWTKTFQADMRARSVASDGSLGATSTIGGGVASSLVWDGSRYALAFTANLDTFVTHVGSVDRLVISATGDDERSPRLVVTGGGNLTAAYIRVATEPFYGGVARVFLREPAPMRSRSVRP
jgi:hypothetical protein